MLELLAIAPEDGWALVRSGGRGVRLVRPPYTKNSAAFVSEDSVSVAVSKHGFLVPGPEHSRFSNWRELVAYLDGGIGAARGTQVSGGLPDDAGEQLLEFAPPDVLREFLRRVEEELIPEGRWDHAENLLLKMLVLDSVCGDPGLRDKAVKLLKRVSSEKEAKAAAWSGLAMEGNDIGKRFPRATEEYGSETIGRIAQAVQNRGMVFAFGS